MLPHLAPPPAPRRIFLTTDAVGGVWTHALELARGLALRGMDVTLAILGPRPSPRQMAEAGCAARILITDLPLDWTEGHGASLQAAGCELARMAAAYRADLVHLNSPSLAAGGAFDMPLVVGCHSCVATWWETLRGTALPPELARQRALVAAGYRNAHGLVAPSAAFAWMTAEHYALRQAPRVVHNGRAGTTAARGNRQGIVAAGRLWDEAKGIALLNRIAPHLSLPIEVAGPLAAPHGGHAAYTNLRHLGMLEPAEMAARLAAAKIFVAPARYEPFGLAVLEAGQAGCALLLSDIPSLREIWGDAADYAPPGDDAAFLAALRRLLDDDPHRAQRGIAAERRAARYSGDAFVEGMISVYRDALRNRAEVAA